MTTKKVTPQEANRALSRLADDLEGSEAISQGYAEALLRQAQGLAASHPTPQARMAAQGMGVRQGRILSLSGGAPADVAAGSEFGSGIYRQFGPRNTRGYWLLPSAENPNAATIAAGEEQLDKAVDEAVRRA